MITLSLDESGSGFFQCPVSGLEFNGKYKFYVLRTCGHVLSGKALKEVKSSGCLVCRKEFTEEDKIVINGNVEEVAVLREKMEVEKSKVKEKKGKRHCVDGESLVEVKKGSVKKLKTGGGLVAPVNATKEVYASIFTSSRKSEFKETYSCSTEFLLVPPVKPKRVSLIHHHLHQAREEETGVSGLNKETRDDVNLVNNMGTNQEVEQGEMQPVEATPGDVQTHEDNNPVDNMVTNTEAERVKFNQLRTPGEFLICCISDVQKVQGVGRQQQHQCAPTLLVFRIFLHQLYVDPAIPVRIRASLCPLLHLSV
ncbi:hypothetical protein IFM89_029529 [Coptis chinensis]|uniref:Replication termination factor 2 n=1 Tax=Coptis chinensis TaxID=261450 RepID=A0A835LC23_9MAGN|nr:hypothetical protein IFM89_029529 [Coptis chinensis]